MSQTHLVKKEYGFFYSQGSMFMFFVIFKTVNIKMKYTHNESSLVLSPGTGVLGVLTYMWYAGMSRSNGSLFLKTSPRRGVGF